MAVTDGHISDAVKHDNVLCDSSDQTPVQEERRTVYRGSTQALDLESLVTGRFLSAVSRQFQANMARIQSREKDV